MDLWTQRVTVTFRRNLRFYERRFDIVRHFEEAGELRDFRVTDERISLRLGDARHRVGFGATHFDGVVLDPSGDPARVEAAIRFIGEQLAPERMVRPEMVFQWLIPVDKTYDEARRAAARVLFTPDCLTDFALILDGDLPEPAGRFQIESGVLEVGEIPHRLNGERSGLLPFDSEAPPTLWPAESLPAVALYGGILCFPEAHPKSAEALLELWNDTKVSAERLMSEVMAIYVPHVAHEL